MSVIGRLCCKSRQVASVELNFEIIESGSALLTLCYVLECDFELIFRAKMIKILLQQYRP